MKVQALAGFGLNLEISWSDILPPHNNRYNARHDLHLSGTSLDIAIALQKCGVTVKLLGAVGRNDQLNFDGLIEADLAARNLPHSLLRLREQTPIASIETPSGRHLSSKHEMRGTDAVPIEQIVREAEPKLRIASGLMPDEEEVEFAKRFFCHGFGLRVLNFRRAFSTKAWELLRDIAALTDLLYLNRHEAAAFLDCHPSEVCIQNASQLLELGPQTVIVTKDSDGAILVDKNGVTLSVPAYNAGEKVDPSGAGDCFLAFFLAALLEACSFDEALYRATVAAGIKVTRLGAHNMPSLEEVAKTIATK